MASPASRYLRPLSERPLYRGKRSFGVAAGAANQSAREPLGVVEQNFQNVFRGELLVIFSERQRLGRLNEPLGAVGITVEVHVLIL